MIFLRVMFWLIAIILILCLVLPFQTDFKWQYDLGFFQYLLALRYSHINNVYNLSDMKNISI